MLSASENTVISIENGRFYLPPGYAEKGAWLAVTTSLAPCLLVFYQKDWDPLRDKILAARWPDSKWPDAVSSEAQQSYVRRQLIGCSMDLTVSRNGSILLEPEWTRYAGIEHELLWVPANQCIELWNPSRFRERCRVGASDSPKATG